MTSPSLGLTESQLLLLVGTFYLLSCLQVLNAALVLNQRGDKKRARRALYEILLSLHLVLMAALANSACHGWLPPLSGIGVHLHRIKNGDVDKCPHQLLWNCTGRSNQTTLDDSRDDHLVGIRSHWPASF